MTEFVIPETCFGFKNRNLKVKFLGTDRLTLFFEVYTENNEFITDAYSCNIDLLRKGFDKDYFIKQKVYFLENKKDGQIHLNIPSKKLLRETFGIKLIPGNYYTKDNGKIEYLYLGNFDGLKIFVDTFDILPFYSVNIKVKKQLNKINEKYRDYINESTFSGMFRRKVYLCKSIEGKLSKYLDCNLKCGIIGNLKSKKYGFFYVKNTKNANYTEAYKGFYLALSEPTQIIEYIKVPVGFHKDKEKLKLIQQFLES